MIPIKAQIDKTIQMVEIPEGIIELRDDRLKKEWSVQIQGFLMSKYLVTQEQYEAVMKHNPATFKGVNKPVEGVSWLDAITFCNRLSELHGYKPCYQLSMDGIEVEFERKADGYRLPNEAEWEYSCKSGSDEVRYGVLNEIAWYRDNSLGTTHDVGGKVPNAWGLYDMLGNVWEWCADIYDETVYGSYRIIRGGGWNDEARGCLATNRRRSHPKAFKIDDLGFRIARTLN